MSPWPWCYNGNEKAVGMGVLARLGLKNGLVLAVVGIATLGLSSCGREGPLELPPGPAPASPPQTSQLTMPDGSPAPGSAQDTALKNGFDAQGNPVAAPGQKRSFILDPLLQ
jgi:predicted small lipoprotein YifL